MYNVASDTVASIEELVVLPLEQSDIGGSDGVRPLVVSSQVKVIIKAGQGH